MTLSENLDKIINQVKKTQGDKFVNKLNFSKTIFTSNGTKFTVYHKEWDEFIDITPYQLIKIGIRRRPITIKYNLQTEYPDIAKEFHPTKNNELLPTDFAPKTRTKIWWRCSTNSTHVWDARISERTRDDDRYTGCPHCNNKNTSLQEQKLFFYLKKIDSSFENRKKVNGFEFDLYSEKLKIAIEYDGGRWHNQEEKIKVDIKKNETLPSEIKLIRIREFKCIDLPVHKDVLVHKLDKQKYLKSGFDFIKNYVLNNTCDIEEKSRINKIVFDTKKDHTEIQNFIKRIKVENSIATTHPHLLLEWDYELNGATTPEMITHGNGEKFFWKCLAGLNHPSYPMKTYSRTKENKPCGCQKCGNIKTTLANQKRIFPK